MPAGRAILLVLLGLGLGSLVNISSLTAAAERQPFGWRRDAALVLVAPLELASRVFGLDQPRMLVDATIGREPDPAPPPPQPTEEPAAAVRPELVTPSATPAPTVSPGQPRREITAAEPLRVWVIGDSLTEQLGPSLQGRFATSPVATVEHEFHYSTGLSRPDFFDWPARAEEIIAAADPDAWVVFIGANDAQDIRRPDGQFMTFGEPDWEATYRQRVGDLMDTLGAGGRSVVWIGEPVMRSADFDARMASVSAIYEQEAAERPAVTFVDSRALSLSPEGGYAAYLPGADGQLQLARLTDGIHFTRAGSNPIAEAVAAALDQRWGLSEAATAATPTPAAASTGPPTASPPES